MSDTGDAGARARIGDARIGLVWAQAADGIIGADGGMPWHVPEDLAHFKRVTMGSPVVMGRKTWESFPARFRPLPGRRNIVITRRSWQAEGAETAHSIAAALELAADGLQPNGVIWVIGGGGVFSEVIDDADVLEVTELDIAVDGDTRAPAIGSGWRVVATDPKNGWLTSTSGVPYRFLTYHPRTDRSGH